VDAAISGEVVSKGQFANNALSDLVLKIKDIVEPTIKPICPKMCPGRAID